MVRKQYTYYARPAKPTVAANMTSFERIEVNEPDSLAGEILREPSLSVLYTNSRCEGCVTLLGTYMACRPHSLHRSTT